MSKRAVVVLAPGFEEIEALAPVDSLRRAGVTVTLAGLGGTTIRSTREVGILADTTFDQIREAPDALILPGGMPGSENLGKSEAVRRLAVATRDAGGILAAICAAPALTLAAWGLLAGKRATCHPGFETKFPADVEFSEERVVVDGNVVTSRGPGTALEWSFALAHLLVSESAAQTLRERMLAR